MTLVNFSTPVTFNVRAEDGTVSAWKVKLTNNDYSIAWGLGLFISEERSNEGTRPQGWFLTQQNTGPQSNNNCGPAVTVMAANWSDASFAETIQDARNRIPYGENGEVNWNPNDVCRYLFMNQIPYVKEQLPAASLPFAELKAKFITQVKGYIDDDRIAILCLSTSYISYDPEQDLECRVGRFYSNVFYHFIVVKGYKMVDGQLYFEVNDPWNFGEQYKDGSPKGKNRYYSSDDLCKTSAYNANVVVVSLK